MNCDTTRYYLTPQEVQMSYERMDESFPIMLALVKCESKTETINKLVDSLDKAGENDAHVPLAFLMVARYYKDSDFTLP